MSISRGRGQRRENKKKAAADPKSQSSGHQCWFSVSIIFRIILIYMLNCEVINHHSLSKQSIAIKLVNVSWQIHSASPASYFVDLEEGLLFWNWCAWDKARSLEFKQVLLLDCYPGLLGILQVRQRELVGELRKWNDAVIIIIC